MVRTLKLLPIRVAMLTIKTSDPMELLQKIKMAIQEGHILDWQVDSDGDFTQTHEEFKNRAFLEPIILVGELRFELITFKQHRISKSISGVFQARFLEMLSTHFESEFIVATVIVN